MNHEMLRSSGLIVDQCYTFAWRESKYTLIHVSDQSRTRISNIQKLMTKLQAEHGIIPASICGFETIISNGRNNTDELENHPGFRLIVDALNTKRDALEWWMETGDLINNRKGLLWKHIEDIDVTTMTKAQLTKRAREWVEMKKEIEALRASNTFLNGQIQHAGDTMKPKPPSTRTILSSYRKNHAARDLMKQVIKAEKKLNKQEVKTSDGSGEIYAAWNELMQHLFKLGFTCRDAETRVKELQTAGVLEPFQLVRHARVPNARLYEKAMHIYFKDVRVYKRKEFFAVSAEEIHTFFDIVEGNDTDHTEEQEQWAKALARAAERR